MIKTMSDVYDYIEKQYSKKLSESEKVVIRFRMIVLRESVRKIFDDFGIDASKVKIQ